MRGPTRSSTSATKPGFGQRHRPDDDPFGAVGRATPRRPRPSGRPPDACTRQPVAVDDRLDEVAVPWLAGERGVEVDHVQPRRPGVGEALRGCDRVDVVDGLGVGATLGQPDGTAVLDVDGRVERQHGGLREGGERERAEGARGRTAGPRTPRPGTVAPQAHPMGPPVSVRSRAGRSQLARRRRPGAGSSDARRRAGARVPRRPPRRPDHPRRDAGPAPRHLRRGCSAAYPARVRSRRCPRRRQRHRVRQRARRAADGLTAVGDLAAAPRAGGREVRWLETTPGRGHAHAILHGIVGDRFAADHPALDLPVGSGSPTATSRRPPPASPRRSRTPVRASRCSCTG